jgi:hypothetical protein
MPATATLSASIVGLLSGTVDIGSVEHSLSYGPTIPFSDGTGANQINRIWADTRTLAASGTEDLDLAGSLVDAIGQSITFARVKAILIRPSAANTNNVIVGGASANQFLTWVGGATHTVTVRPGGLFAIGAPDATAYAVTAGTGDLLRIANSSSGTSVTYDIVILGATA